MRFTVRSPRLHCYWERTFFTNEVPGLSLQLREFVDPGHQGHLNRQEEAAVMGAGRQIFPAPMALHYEV